VNKKKEIFLWKLEILLEKYLSKISLQKKKELWKDFSCEGYFETENKGNNQFSFYPGKKIWVSPIQKGTEFSLGTEIVFSDNAKESRGLEANIFGYTEHSNIPFFLCDNHNRVLEAWEHIPHPFFVVHVDMHYDSQKYEGDIQNWKQESTIVNYLDIAYKLQWREKEYLCFCNSFVQQDFSILVKKETVVLNLDLDFFDPENTVYSLEEKIEIIAKVLPCVSYITVATSPLFIDQDLAIKIAKILYEKM
jgi:hypothetical protein